jgi:hypothetical protein
MAWPTPNTPWLTATLLLALGCSDTLEDAGADRGGDPTSFDGGFGNGGSDDNGGNGGPGGDGLDAGLPAEQEEELAFDLPQAGAKSVYIPNPITDRVAVVNAETFAIETVRAGAQPTYTATVPGKDVAIVLNVGTSDATLLRTVSGKTSTLPLPVGHEANAIAVAPDGQHAVIYFDARDPDRTAQSFQDVTVVSLEEGKESARGVSVGFRPSSVQFSADGAQAFVITEDGISVLSLRGDTGPLQTRLVGLGTGLGDPLPVDLAVTPDGRFALARIEGKPLLLRIDLATSEIKTLDMTALQAEIDADDAGADASTIAAPLAPGKVELTDLDVAADGSFAVAVARGQRALIRVPIPKGFDDLSQVVVTAVEGQLVGSVSLSADGNLAVAYTTAAPVEGVVIVDLEGAAPQRGIRLRKTVRAVALSNDGTRVLVLHAKKEGRADLPGLEEEERIDRSEGYSLVDTTSGFAKLQLTDARVSVRNIVVTPTASQMFALIRDDTRFVRALQRADLTTFQVVTTPLVAPPSSIGLVPGVGRLFVGQELSGGMITFVDSETGEVVKAVTGFELTSRIRQ